MSIRSKKRSGVIPYLTVIVFISMAQIAKCEDVQSVADTQLGQMYWPLPEGAPAGTGYFSSNCDGCKIIESLPLSDDEVKLEFYRSDAEFFSRIKISADFSQKFGFAKVNGKFETRTEIDKTSNILKFSAYGKRALFNNVLSGIPLTKSGMTLLKYNLRNGSIQDFIRSAGDEYVRTVKKGAIFALEYTLSIEDISKMRSLRTYIQAKWKTGAASLDYSSISKTLGTQVTGRFELKSVGIDTAVARALFYEGLNYDSLRNFEYVIARVGSVMSGVTRESAATIGFTTASLLANADLVALALDSAWTYNSNQNEIHYNAYLRFFEHLTNRMNALYILKQESMRIPDYFNRDKVAELRSLISEMESVYREAWANLNDSRQGLYDTLAESQSEEELSTLRYEELDLREYLKVDPIIVADRVCCRGTIPERPAGFRQNGVFFLTINLPFPDLFSSVTISRYESDTTVLFNEVSIRGRNSISFAYLVTGYSHHSTMNGAKQELNDRMSAENNINLQLKVLDKFGKIWEVIVDRAISNPTGQCNADDLKGEYEHRLQD